MPVEKLLSEMLTPSPADAQLQQVETQAKPAATIVPEVTEQAARRRRRPPAMVADTPVELMQVETKNTITAAVDSTIEASNPVPQARRPRRAAVPQPAVPEAPLQQIETRR